MSFITYPSTQTAVGAQRHRRSRILRDGVHTRLPGRRDGVHTRLRLSGQGVIAKHARGWRWSPRMGDLRITTNKSTHVMYRTAYSGAAHAGEWYAGILYVPRRRLSLRMLFNHLSAPAHLWRSIVLALIAALALVVAAPAATAEAAGLDSSRSARETGIPTPPLPILGPRLSPPAIPHSMVWDPIRINTPVNALEADAFDGGRQQEEPGRGIRQTLTGFGAGLTLYDSPHVCTNFNEEIAWSGTDGNPDIWSEWYSGWAPFALDEDIYQAKNVTFNRERVVGPGDAYNDNEDTDGQEQYSVKIASNQPYAAGFGSPRIAVPAGFEEGTATVSVKYLIWDHDGGGDMDKDGFDYDWASLGVKPDADGHEAFYINGYVRGEWSEIVNTVELTGANDIMVLLNAQSPGPFNSNIYFDNISIGFTNADGETVFLQDCAAEEAVR